MAQQTNHRTAKRLKDPKGGLTAAGRKRFAEVEGAHLRPGVRGAADTPDKMRRKGSFLQRHFANPRGPMVDEHGAPTRLALSAHAWGEPVPKTMAAAKKLAAKGAKLLERYAKAKEAAGKPSTKARKPAARTRKTRSTAGASTAAKRPAARRTAARKTATKGTKRARTTAKKPAARRPATRSTEKNSLVGNINRRKRAGTSRPKSRSHVSAEAYEEMERGWPHSAARKAAAKRAPAARRKSS